MRILVAIPAYNCENQITRVLEGFDEKLLEMIEEVIVIDDCGNDKTAHTALKTIQSLNISKKVKVVRNNGNLGLGGSHKMAFLYGEQKKMDYVAILHGDNQARTEELCRLIEVAIKKPDLGAILGCRFMKGSKLSGYSWQRIWGNRIINLVYSLFTLRRSMDLGSGLNLFRLIDLSDHHYLGFDDKMTFNIDLLLDYYTKKTRLIFIPISWTEKDQISNAKNFNIAKIAVKQLALWRIGKLPARPMDSEKYVSTLLNNVREI